MTIQSEENSFKDPRYHKTEERLKKGQKLHNSPMKELPSR